MFVRVGFVVHRRRRILRGTEALVECGRVSGVESEGRDIGSSLSLLQVNNPVDLLIELVGWQAGINKSACFLRH